MMRSVNRETMLTNNQHNQLVVTRKKVVWTWHHPSFFLSVGWVGGVSNSVSLQSALLFLLLSLYLCLYFFLSLSLPLSQSLSLSTLRSRLLGFLAEHRDQRKREKKKNRRSNLWRTSLLKCATFYFSANYPHAVHRLKAVLWLSLQPSKAVTVTHSAVGVSQLQGEAKFFSVSWNL